MQPKEVAVTSNKFNVLRADNAGQGRTALGMNDEVGVPRHFLDQRRAKFLFLVQLLHLVAGQGDLGHAGPSRVRRELRSVFFGGESDTRCLDSQRKILGHDDDIESFLRKVESDREDAGVVVP